MTNQASAPAQESGPEEPGQSRPHRPPGRRQPWPAALLIAYPPDWRGRYGEELELLIQDLHAAGRAPIPMAFDLLCGAATAWLTTGRRTLMSERSSGALITVLWSWVAFGGSAERPRRR
jgi:hypothetical protein